VKARAVTLTKKMENLKNNPAADPKPGFSRIREALIGSDAKAAEGIASIQPIVTHRRLM
jgi:hypothetical protein